MRNNHFNLRGPLVSLANLNFDNRGYFREWFKSSLLESQEILDFIPKQANLSKSKKGTIRGIHFSLNPKKQSKLITCVQGAIFDVVVDLRPNSKTFGKWEYKILSGDKPESVYIPFGFGHGFQALKKNTIVTYLQTDEYNPSLEKSLNPLDPILDIAWPLRRRTISSKDRVAPNLIDLQSGNLLTPFEKSNP
jgi:dTDP-4-dehydrorhamnose 3,5-epimerase